MELCTMVYNSKIGTQCGKICREIKGCTNALIFFRDGAQMPLRRCRQTDGQTESDEYEPTVQIAQVGSIEIKAN